MPNEPCAGVIHLFYLYGSYESDSSFLVPLLILCCRLSVLCRTSVDMVLSDLIESELPEPVEVELIQSSAGGVDD